MMDGAEETLRQQLAAERAARREAEAKLSQIEVQARQEGRRSGDLYYLALLKNLPDGVLLKDQHGVIRLINQQFCDLFAIKQPAEVLIGQPGIGLHQALADQFCEPERFLEHLRTLRGFQELSVGEEWALRDGRFLACDYVPIRQEGGYAGYLWRYRDITLQKRATELVRKSEDKYRQIIDGLRLSMLEVDREGLVVKVYDQFTQQMGYTEADLLGKNPVPILLGEQFQDLLDTQNADRLRGKSNLYEVPMRHKNGHLVWMALSGAPIYDEEGAVAGSVGVHLNINELKQTQQALEKARQAEKLFLANISHELRTPINAIIGMTHLLLDTQPTAQQTEYLHDLKHSANLLLGLVTDVLDISKIDAGEVQVQTRPFNLPDLVSGLMQTFRWQVANRPVSIRCDVAADVPVMVTSDDTMLQQILMNLLNNAVEFTEQGEIGVRVTAKWQHDTHYDVQFVVYDTGQGMAPEQLANLFDRFKQADGATRVGAGLGLTIVRHVVQLLGGQIDVASRLGQGSTFTITLPMQANVAPEQRSAVADPAPLTPTDKPALPLAGRHVLVAEDNELNRKYVQKLLEKWGATCTLVDNGRDVVEQAQQQPFDAILMDINMPHMNGFDATAAVRAMTGNANQNIPILALTAAALADVQQRATAVGMNDFLSKPFRPQSLQDALVRQLT